MSFNVHLRSQFSGCRLLGNGHDPHRNRDVRFYAIPGQFDVVGITDGAESFIAPASSPFLAPYKKALDDLHQGKEPQPINTPRRRERHSFEEAPRAEARPAEPESNPRRRERHSFDEEPEIRPRARRSLSS